MHIGGTTKYRFWMVYGEGQGAPTYKHDSEEAASEEAQRLALRNPGCAFYVLKGVGRAMAAKPEVAMEKLVKPTGVIADQQIPW